jgi:ribulose 1,5-bisphosphate synthetase/thiazole synthase
MNKSVTKYSKYYDVLVAGGGVAGVSAAVASAREGMNTALVEKTIIFGGLATSGLILVYLPLSDSRGNQVTFGLAEELLHASIKYGPGDVPSDWRDPKTGSRYSAWFSPASFALALDEVLLDAGVDLWLDTLICDTVVKGDRVVGIEVENKSGRGFIGAKCVIDATGDADVAYHAGAPCVEQDNWLSVWAMEASLETAGQAVSENSGRKLNSSRRLGASDTGEGAPDRMRKFYGTNGKDVSEFVLEGHKLLREFYKSEQSLRGLSGRNDIFPMVLPSVAQFRTIRRIEGIKTLKTGEFRKHFDDCVGMVADWRGGRDVWEVPYYTLVPQKVKGLLTAGRCISAEGEAWQVMRVIQAAVHTGEIAGLSAALSVRLDTTPDSIDMKALQNQLKQKGFLIDICEL